jgi:hypothetical protein
MSALAVFLLSLLAAHLRQELVPVVILPFAFVSGLAIRKCADIARASHPPRCWPCVWRQRFAAGCLLLAGLTHIYWVVFDRYRDEAIEANQQRQAEMAREVMAEIADANPAGLSTVFELTPDPPTFPDYLRDRIRSNPRLPEFLAARPWPAIVFGIEVLVATWLGVWLAVAASPSLQTPPLRAAQGSDPPPGSC